LFVAGVGCGEYGRQDAADRPYAAVEAEFADHDDVGEYAWVDAFGGAEYRAGDGEVEAAAGFGYGGRAESDGEFFLRPFRAGVDHCGSDAVPALGQALVGQAHEGEGGDAGF
jgi:hypothetical protein